jgi:hypothetical protein
MSSKQDYIIINKPTATTTKELYSNTYSKQSLEILKLTVGFLLSQLLLKILNEAVFDNFYNNKVLLVILIIVYAVSIYLVGTELYTYIKIQSDKEQLLKDLSR